MTMEQHWYEGLAYITITHYFNEHPIEKRIGCRSIEDVYEHRYEIIDSLINEIKRYEKEILRKQLTKDVTPVNSRGMYRGTDND